MLRLRRIRAILLALVVLGNLIAALPRPSIKAEELDEPDVWHDELQQWVELLGGALTEDQLRTLTVGATRGWQRVLKVLRWPGEPFYRATHTNQQWGLFAIVSQSPERLVIEVRRDGTWETLYRRLDPAYTWHEEELKYRRIRGIWDGVKDPPKGTYKRFTIWLARTIFLEQPDVDRVRVKLEKNHPTLPWDEPNLEVSYRAEKYHKREVLMDQGEPEEVIPADPPAAEDEP